MNPSNPPLRQLHGGNGAKCGCPLGAPDCLPEKKPCVPPTVPILLDDLAQLTDEIEGVTLPVGMVGPYSITLHTTEQVVEWLEVQAAKFQQEGVWNPWRDTDANVPSLAPIDGPTPATEGPSEPSGDAS